MENLEPLANEAKTAIAAAEDSATLEQLRLIGGGELRFPTAAMARIDFEVDRWNRVRPATGSLVWFVIPRLLKAAGLC